MITSGQIRAARALLRIPQGESARRTRLSVTTIRRLEASEATVQVAEGSVKVIQEALEEAGAEFIADGVRRRPRQRDPDATYRALRAIAERSAAELAYNPILTDDDLYDEHGLPR